MRRVLATFLLAALASCGGDSVTDVSAGIAGTYSLRTVNGSPLPYAFVVIGANKVEILDDAVTINDGGTYSGSGHIRITENGRVTTESVAESGTYSRNGTTITFRPSDNTIPPTTGALSGSSITIILDTGVSAVYSK